MILKFAVIRGNSRRNHLGVIFMSPMQKRPHILIVSLALLLQLFQTSCKEAPKNEIQMIKESASDGISAFQQFSDALYPVRNKDKWGYINRKGEIVLQPQWEDAGDFYEGLAKAATTEESNMRYGFINSKGEWIVKPIYQRAFDFSDGFAVVQRNDLYGYVNSSGREIIPCQFEEAGPFSEGYAAIKKGGWTGFINTSGVIVVEPAYTVSVHHPRFKEGLAPVFGADEQTGFVDTTGQWGISAQFHSAGNFVDGLAWAMWQQDDSSAEHGFTIKGGYIDREGVYVIPPEYDFGWDFSEGLATVWVRSEDKQQKIWKIIDREGNVVLDNQLYRNVGAMNQGLIPIQNDDMKWGFMDRTGTVIIPPQYAGINHFRNGLARMEVGTAFSNTIVYINPKGEMVWAE